MPNKNRKHGAKSVPSSNDDIMKKSEQRWGLLSSSQPEPRRALDIFRIKIQKIMKKRRAESPAGGETDYTSRVMVLVFGGSLVLKEFTSLRYQFRKVQMMTPQEAAEKTGIKLKHKEKQSLEDIYMELLEKDNDSWENIRGPRPWEDSRQVQNEQRALQKL